MGPSQDSTRPLSQPYPRIHSKLRGCTGGLWRPEDIGSTSAEGLSIREITLLGFWPQPLSSGEACETPPIYRQLEQPMNLDLMAVCGSSRLKPEQEAGREPPTRLGENEARNTTASVGRGGQELPTQF